MVWFGKRAFGLVWETCPSLGPYPPHTLAVHLDLIDEVMLQSPAHASGAGWAVVVSDHTSGEHLADMNGSAPDISSATAAAKPQYSAGCCLLIPRRSEGHPPVYLSETNPDTARYVRAYGPRRQMPQPA